MQEVVDQMGATKADAVLGRGLLLEGEVGGQPVVHQEAEHVADGIGHVDIDPVLEDPVDGIVDGGCRGAHDAEADKLTERFFLLHSLSYSFPT